MKNYWKSYNVFLANILIKIVMFLIYPVITILFGGLVHLATTHSSGYAAPGLLTAGSIIVSAELLLDMFVYGGILNKDTNKLEYLKTSHRGIMVLEKSLLVDKIRRLLMTYLLLAIICFMGSEKVNPLQLISLTLATCMVTELMLLVSRHMTEMTWIMLFIMLASIMEVGVGCLAIFLPPLCVIVFLGLFAGVFILSKRVILKKNGGQLL